jgi:hypothetical protein
MADKFNKGDVVRSQVITILVTGKGKKDVGYPVFAGVVLKEGDPDSHFHVGFYSKTWTESVFEKTDIDIKALIP